MPTHDFIAPNEIDQARHEQNMPLGIDTPAPESWVAQGPGYDLDPVEIEDNDPLQGNPGPNVGYAYRLLSIFAEDIVLVEGEHRHDVEPLLAEIAMRRAAFFSRAPISADAGFAIRILGYAGTPTKGEEKWRPRLVKNAGHDEHRRRKIVNSIPHAIIEGDIENFDSTVSGWWEKLEELF